MSSVAVVTDTTHYLPPHLLEEFGVHQVSLYVKDGAGLHREADITDLTAFYDRLRAADDLPTTSQPSIGDFLEVYEPLAAAGHDVLSVHLSGDISGTVESARQAAAELAERHPGRRVEIVDSKSACGGLGMIVLAAAHAAREGGSLDAVTSATHEGIERARLWFAVDTLEFLRRGGRIGSAQAWLGGALKIKPILTIDGQITPIERVRTSGRAFERMMEFLAARKEDGATSWVIQHIQDHERVERLVERGRELFGTEPLWVSEIGPVIGAHVGPGLLGVGGLPPALVGRG